MSKKSFNLKQEKIKSHENCQVNNDHHYIIHFCRMRFLKAPVINQIEPIESYKYVYITPTSELTSGSSGVYGRAYGVYGGGSTKTINLSDVISGILLKQGYAHTGTGPL